MYILVFALFMYYLLYMILVLHFDKNAHEAGGGELFPSEFI